MKALMWIVILALLGAAGYAAWELGKPRIAHYRFRSKAEYIIKFEARDEAELRSALSKKAREFGLDLPENSFEIERTKDGEFFVKAAWTNTVDLMGKYKRTYNFTLEVRP